jgi:hypothetical protein
MIGVEWGPGLGVSFLFRGGELGEGVVPVVVT